MKDFLEQEIIFAVKKLLKENVNELLKNSQYVIPLIEFGGSECGVVICPVITMAGCEQTEKERIIRQDTYSLTIIFKIPESSESELHCYAYSGAVSRVIYENPTLLGQVDGAVITGKKYQSPKKPHCGEGWELTLTLRMTVEGC